MAISAAEVKKLREKTGAGMMDCKRALEEAGGDFEKAVDILRKKGLAAAQKKSARVAAEGMAIAKSRGDLGVALEVNSETDFVARNELFQSFVQQLADLILDKQPKDLAELKALPFAEGRTVEEATVELIAKIGENIQIRRFAVLSGDHVASYVHMGGKIAVLVAFAGEVDPQLARQIAMHVAAANPKYLDRESVPEEDLAREREVLLEQARATGKPEHVLEKIVEGRLRKFYEENCLLEQAFVVDPDKKVADVLGDARITGFVRYQLGEGIEKQADDFAAEVAAQAGLKGSR
ncbi:MAG: elongation factor Ts [Zetaproteobacteria bacterium]|nr:MAG: elongation factor Ts [Zetaproteobacteria bacterium]